MIYYKIQRVSYKNKSMSNLSTTNFSMAIESV